MWGPLYRLALTVVVAGSPLAAAAQGVPSTALPGREREQFQDTTPPLSRPVGPAVTLPSTEPPEGAATIKVRLRSVTVVGSTVYSREQLAAIYGDLIGREVSLAEVYDLAKKITAQYGKDGYVLSRAIVPPQNFSRSGADIKIQVVEGYVDQVVWPDKLSRYRDFFSDYTARILADRPANVRTLERYLLLAGDLPGLKFSTKLRPSTRNPGASTLVVEVTEKPYDAAARVDNRGSKARGPYQYLVTGTANNLLGAHEAFTLTYGGTFQFQELQFGAAAYRQVLNSEGLTGFANVSYGAGKPYLGAELDILAYKTRSLVFEAGLSYPVIRTRERNLILTGLMFASDSEGDMLDALFSRDRLRGFRLRADYDMADSLRGINRFSATFSKGIHGFGSTDNGNLLASVANGRVDFSKIEFSASRVQPLGAGFSLAVAAETQYAFNTLLAPEQCGFGGRNIGRAFDPSELTGDHCWMASAELRYDLPVGALAKDHASLKYLKQSQIYTFLDRGEAYRREPSAGTPESQTGTSAGLGLRLGWMENALLDLSAAKAVAGPRDDWRFFFIATIKN